MYSVFLQNYNAAVSAIAPLRRRALSRHPWVNRACLRVIAAKSSAWKRWKRSRSALDHLTYIQARRHCTYRLKEHRRAYETRLVQISRNTKNTQALFRYINKNCGLKCKEGVGILRRESDGAILASDTDIVAELNQYFRKVLSGQASDVDNVYPVVRRTEAQLNDIEFSAEEVSTILKNLDHRKAPGPDGPHCAVLKNCRDALASPLYHIFRRSLDAGLVPSQWKEAYITPVFKGSKAGSRDSCTSYRPISLTSQVGKVMERLVKQRVLEFLEANSILRPAQHGFRQGRSCVTNLLDMLEEVTRAIDDGYSVDVAFLDFSKAFDKVNHAILIRKMESYGISGKILLWIRDFLRNRSQRTCVRGSRSEAVPVSSGVPQGSVLGPLLFLVYVNDLPEVSPCVPRLFADDTTVLNIVRSDVDDRALQSALTSLESWSRENVLPFNPSKCTIVRFCCTPCSNLRTPFSLNGDAISFGYAEKDLGVLLTSNLDPARHIAAIVQRANFVLGLVRRAFVLNDIKLFVLLYKTLVRPHLEYAVQAWNPWKQKDIKKLEKVQRRATRLVPQCRGLSYDGRLRLLGLPTLEARRRRGDLILVFRIVKGLIGLDFNRFFTYARNPNTRGHQHKLDVQRHRLNLRSKFFSIRVVNDWNALPDAVVSATTVNGFKTKYDAHIEHQSRP